VFNKLGLLILIGSLAFLSTRCTDCEQVSYNLPTDLQLKQNPFTGNEKIKFKTNQSYMEFIGSRRKNYTKEWSVATCENQILGYDEMKLVGNSFEISMRIEGKQGFYDITIYDILQGINMFSDLKIDPTSGKL
jgi:hypothetical protein